MIITLTTDFGLSDPFVGIMKGVILGIAPEARIVDICHDIQSYEIMEGAYLIETSYRYFPAGTVHIVVVDPGVGSARRPIAAVANGHIFVAPDNGVLSGVFGDEGSDPLSPKVHHITNSTLFLNSVSRTFHGRDLFAPVAAHLAEGISIDSVGPRILDFVRRPLPEPKTQGSKVIASVLRIDKYGNIVTNLRRAHLDADFTIRIAGYPIRRLCGTFSEAGPGEFVAVEGSTGFIEIALNQGSAADRLNVECMSEIEVESGPANH